MAEHGSGNLKYDLVTIGSGPAGITGALQASKGGKRAAIIEASDKNIGGTWIHTGTIPSKSLREVLDAIQSIRPHVGSNWVQRIVDNLDSTKLISRANQVSGDEENLMRKHLNSNNIDIITGFGFIENDHQVRVSRHDGSSLLVDSDIILIASGSRPRRPKDIPFDGWRVIDSDDVLRLEQLPKSILIFGAGVVGCEYACIMGALGIDTTIVDARSRIMQFVDQEIAEELRKSMEDLGVKFMLGVQLESLQVSGPKTRTTFSSGEVVDADVFFFTAGRESATNRMGLERVGIEINDRNAILVNEYFQTKVPNIYAAGDAIGPPALAATSIEQARIAVSHAFQGSTRKFPKVFPVGVYTIPELSSVGKSEEELKAEGVDYVVGHASYDEIARGYIRGDHHGLLKIIACKKSLKLLGIHIVGADAANLVHVGQCAMLSGMVLQDLVNEMIFNYPTLGEAYRVAAFNALNKLYPSGVFDEKSQEKKSVA